MKNRVSKSILASFILVCSCQVQNIPLSNSNNGFSLKSFPTSSPSSDLPPLTEQPLDVESDPNKIVDDSSDLLEFEKQTIDYNYIPPESAEIEPGRIIVFYHNTDKFRVRTTASVSSVNSYYAQQVNAILDKYNVESVHSFGYYDPADADRIICIDKKHKKKKDDKKDKDDKKFKTKHINDNDHNNDGHHDHGKGNEHDDEENDKKCSTLNYVDSAVTNQKIAEEQALVSKYFNGEYPDDLSVHIYEFPETSDTRAIARELRSLSFIRTAYAEVKIATQGNINSTVIGRTDSTTKQYGAGSSFCSSNTSDIKCPSDNGFSTSISIDSSGSEIDDWYWYNKHNVFKGWEIYGNTSMPKVAVIDSGFDNESDSLDKPNYVGGYSVRYKKQTPDNFYAYTIKNNDVQEPTNSDPNEINAFSHGNFVSSVLGSPKNNGKGLAGIAPNSEILPIKTVDMSFTAAAHSMKKVADDNSVDAINLSFGIKEFKQISPVPIRNEFYGALTQSPLFAKQIEYAVSKNKIVVMAAGNSANKIGSETRINGSIVVGGTTNRNPDTFYQDSGTYIWSDSSYGDIVDIAASAQYILASNYYPNRTANKREYSKQDGTSFATPMVTATAGMVKKLAKANGVELNPFQIKHIITYSANLGQDTMYDLSKTIGERRYLGLDLNNTSHSPNQASNFRNLDLYNALVIAKNLNNYSLILRTHNTDDYAMATEFKNWLDTFGSDTYHSHLFANYQSDILIGLNSQPCQNKISFRTLNQSGGYTYGYQMYYGKKYPYENPFVGDYSGYNFFDKFDGTAGIYGANSNEGTGRKYLAEVEKTIFKDKAPCPTYLTEGKNPTTNKVGSFTTKGFIDNNTSTPPLEVNKGDNAVVSINANKIIDLNNIKVEIGGVQVTLKTIVDNYIVFGITDNIPTGIQDVIVKYVDDSGSITYKDALNILSGQSNKSFPSSITTNNITKNINYGFNFDFNEESGNNVIDKSGKNNNGTFSTLHDLLPLRVNNTAIKFPKGSFITIPYSSSYNLGRKFAFLATFKPHELNREQEILSKWDDGYVNGQFVHSYGMYISSDNKITLTLADNKQQYFSITHNANFTFDLEKEIGIGVIVDLDTDTIKFIKNQTVVDGNIVYSGSPYHYSSLSQLGEVKNSTIPLSIGNYTSRAFNDYSLDLNLNADLSNIASVVEEIKPEEVTKIFYDMDLRD